MCEGWLMRRSRLMGIRACSEDSAFFWRDVFGILSLSETKRTQEAENKPYPRFWKWFMFKLLGRFLLPTSYLKRQRQLQNSSISLWLFFKVASPYVFKKNKLPPSSMDLIDETMTSFVETDDAQLIFLVCWGWTLLETITKYKHLNGCI